jgi:hypothetical protein
MPDVEQSKMVDIDTSGPGADVELENDQPEEKHISRSRNIC